MQRSMKPDLKLHQLQANMAPQLAAAGIKDARKQARLLIQIALGLDNTEFFARADHVLNQDQMDRVNGFLNRRLRGEPIARLVSKAAFFEHEFYLNAHTLVPRPETEHLVEQVLEHLSTAKLCAPQIVDLGTGSGCIILSILTRLVQATGIGVDVAPKALEMAQRNARQLSVTNRVGWVEADMRHTDMLAYLKTADVIVANPPYIRTDEMAKLDIEVQAFDPPLALEAGYDGLIFYRALASHFEKLDHAFFVALEVGQGQAETVAAMLDEAGCENVRIIEDLACIPRIVQAQGCAN